MTIDRGDIWFVNLEPTKGTEQQGARPVLVLSKSLHNRLFPSLVAPITGGGATARARGFAVPLAGFGLQTDGVVLAHKIKAVDIKARGGKKIETAPVDLVDAVVDVAATVLGYEP